MSHRTGIHANRRDLAYGSIPWQPIFPNPVPPDDWEVLAGSWRAAPPTPRPSSCAPAPRLLFVAHDAGRHAYLELDTAGWRIGQVQDGAASTLCSRADWHPQPGVATAVLLDLTAGAPA